MVEDGVCVATHPLGDAGENATRSLLEILAEITPVTLVTANLPADSVIRDRYEVIEVSSEGAGQSIVRIAAMRFLLNQLRMIRAIARRDEEIVLFFGATAYVLPILAAKVLGRTVVLQPRGDVPLTLRLTWESRLPAPAARLLAGLVVQLERIGYLLADGIVTYSPSMASQLGLERFGDKVHPNGARFIDTDRFSVRTPFEERRRVVGYLGRLDEEKGIRTIAEVAARLPPDVRFHFVGDGNLRDWLESRLQTEIADGKVRVAGWIDHDEVPRQLNQMRLLMMPSSPTEGLPTTLLEAFACGTPAFVTPVSGVVDVVEEGRTGFRMESRSREYLVDRTVQILERDDLEEISKTIREIAIDEFDFDSAVGRYRSIVNALRGSSK